ncbi:MAG: hypothetical protein ACUVQP_00130 [Bacteroidales bacterium]
MTERVEFFADYFNHAYLDFPKIRYVISHFVRHINTGNLSRSYGELWHEVPASQRYFVLSFRPQRNMGIRDDYHFTLPGITSLIAYNHILSTVELSNYSLNTLTIFSSLYINEEHINDHTIDLTFNFNPNYYEFNSVDIQTTIWR